MTSTTTALPRIAHRTVEVDGLRVFYRETEARPGAPTLLLLHGFPSSSHQFRRLFDALGGRFRLIAPDYPGFGHSDPPPHSSFDAIADVIEGFVRALDLDRFAMYVFDFGAPVGFRLAARHPEWIAGLVVQNGVAHLEGLTPSARDFVALRPEDEGAEEQIRDLLTVAGTREQYLHGAADPEAISPDGWTLDHHFLELPGRKEIQVDLAFDYKSNVARYPEWQAWLRERRPPTLVVWGRNDIFFAEAGAHAYKQDVPDAEVHLFETGHFALEERLDEIAPLIAFFLERTWPGPTPVRKEPLRIAVIGATGQLGGAVMREALARGHDVTAIARRVNGLDELAGARAVAGDVRDVNGLAELLVGHDAVVAAVKHGDQNELDLVPGAASGLLEALPRAGVRRLLFVGGGASLLTPSGQRFVDAPDFPQEYLNDALAQLRALEILRDSNGAVDWSYASPPPVHLVDGARTGRYRVRAGDLALTDERGESRISVPDYAAAIVDTLESDRFVGARFTAAY